MNQNGAVSSRELGRRFAAHTGITASAGRRSVMKYLAGTVYPNRKNRDALADSLGVAREVFADDEDEESSAVSLDRLLELRLTELLERKLAAREAVA